HRCHIDSCFVTAITAIASFHDLYL
ncbi:hypothetical protein D039_1442B, partial [Vibrio parahaemolyticus EKP-028]